MDAFVLACIIFVALSCIVLPCKLVYDRREARREGRAKARGLMHVIRRGPTRARIQEAYGSCTRYRIPPEDIGTTYGELAELQREACRLEAKEELEKMRKGTHNPRKSINMISDLLTEACRPYDWAAIDTTWTELRDLHHHGLVAHARGRFDRKRASATAADRRMRDGEIEELLALANAVHEDLYPSDEADSGKAS